MKIFGLDGARSTDMAYLCKIGYRLGLALGHKSVVVGMDNRPTSPAIAAAVCQGLRQAEAQVLFGGVMPTPCLQYATRHFVADAGVMITASHNPAHYNGIKVITADGTKPTEAQLEALEAALPEACIQEEAPLPPILDTVRKAYLHQFDRVTPCPMRVGVDCANGATYPLVKQVFARHQIEGVYIHHGEGKAINRACGALHPRDLAELSNVDLKVAFDGDGDRCILVTAQGRVVDGDGILYLLATHLAECNQLPQRIVVGTLMTNGALQAALAAQNIRLARTDVGDGHVWQKMQRERSVLGGEPSGHIVRQDGISDGIMTALMLCEMAQSVSLDEALQSYQPLPQVAVTCPYGEATLQRAQAAADKWKEYLAGTGRIVVRASGTEPVVRIMVECAGESLARTIAESIAQAAVKPKR